MTVIYVTPADIQQRLDQAQPGDEIVLRAGLYRKRLRMKDRSGSAARPITVRAEPGANLDDGVTADAYKPTANQLALDVFQGKVPGYPNPSFPGLYPWIKDGQLVLDNCHHVRLLNLNIQQSWPTLIALLDSSHIEIAGATLFDGTFAIGATGSTTSAISIHDCSWVQDIVDHRMWRETDWRHIHGDPLEDDGWPIDLVGDRRQFDGDFFRGYGIRGNVHILCCSVTAAFNAVHLYNPAADLTLGRDVEVAYCTFREIRDNILEPEDMAHNWWFHHNEIINGHKWFSIEQKSTGYFYWFANRVWYDSIQGPPDDIHSMGGVFKTPKKPPKVNGKHYVFNNSFCTHGAYLGKGVLSQFVHRNNAVRLAVAGDAVFNPQEPASVFGELTAAPTDQEKRFTTDWGGLQIDMRNDLVAHPSWPGQVQAAGYPIQPAAGTDPQFVSWFTGDLTLAAASPCKAASVALDVELVDGSIWQAPAGGDIGAWQGANLFGGPAFVATP